MGRECVPSFVPAWKFIPEFPDYMVSDDGKVYSMKTHKNLTLSPSKNGYMSVELRNESGSKRILVHRLVASAFIPNPDGLPQVNHIDEDKSNNASTNLEWCSAKYNMNYGTAARTRHEKIDYTKPIYKENAIRNSMAMRKPVKQIKNGKVIAEYESAADAGRKLHLNSSHIGECCRGKRYKTVGGFRWQYKRRNDLLASLF